MKDLLKSLSRPQDLLFGLLTAALLAYIARALAQTSLLKVMGPMVLAILLGMALRTFARIPAQIKPGTSFAARWLLRGAIVIMGTRLHFGDVIKAGPGILVLDMAVAFFAIAAITWLARTLKLSPRLGSLIAAGTGICGAAAIAAVAPLVEASEEETALSIAVIASLGTVGTVLYTFLYNILQLSPRFYGIWVGSTLHEVAHVVAASVPGGVEAGNLAVLVKLGRVALLAPAALFFGYRTASHRRVKVPFPLFILGFFFFSLLTTYGVISATGVAQLVALSSYLLTVAMAAIGLNVDLKAFSRVGPKPFVVGIIGFAMLSLLGAYLTTLL